MIRYDEKHKYWYVQVKTKDPVTGKDRWHKKRGFKLKREAQSYEQSFISGTIGSTGSNATFLDVETLYEKSNQCSEQQCQKRRTYFRTRFSELSERPISSITKPELDRWRAELLADDQYATRTKNETIAFVKSVFSYASNMYGIPNNAAFLKKGKFTDNEVMNQEKPVWNIEQFNAFLDCVSLPVYKLFFEFLYWTGCRRGEALAVQKSDFDGRRVFIHASTKHAKNGLKPTKTRTNRWLELDTQLYNDILPLFDTEGPFLFGGISSLPITSCQRYFERARKAAGLDDTKVTIHCLRHSHATYLINHGVNIVAVSKRLGHSSIEITLSTYAHLMKDSDITMMSIIEESHKK